MFETAAALTRYPCLSPCPPRLSGMLQQTKQFLEEERGLEMGKIALVRADVARLPFPTGSLDAVHAGAAIHCWPNPQAALAEISRVLKPGGVFVASTFLKFTAPLGELLGDDLVRPLSQLEPESNSYKWWEEAELQDLCDTVGLGDWSRHRTNRFIMFSVRKPNTEVLV